MPKTDDKNLIRISQDLKTVQSGHVRSIQPLEQWKPKHCGKMDLVIKANGEWWHEGQLIRRQAMLDLFSSVLWKENDRYFLKTPVELIEIEVEDAPLLVNQVDQIKMNNQLYLQLTTQHMDQVIVDAEHPIFMQDYQGEMRPYVHVRRGLNALIQRQTFLHLVGYGELLDNPEGETVLLLKSGDFDLQLGG